MMVRHPPGRSGRPWLAHRLAVARRGAELLQEKQRALMRERARLAPLLGQARAEWERQARAAQEALTRAAMLGGERGLAAAGGGAAGDAAASGGAASGGAASFGAASGGADADAGGAGGAAPAQVMVAWTTVLGVRCPREARVEAAPARARVPAGSSAALQLAAAAHRRALDAAVELAALQRAFDAVDADLRATTLRRIAIERRWVPAHEAALAALELALDASELEDAARVRRIASAGGGVSPQTGDGNLRPWTP
jgi:V/A-type H+/Na+-transporting ATPase subunit D